jgi:hypothetical protein
MTVMTDDFDGLLAVVGGADDFDSLLADPPTETSPLATARRYVAAGWSPVPIPYRTKGPQLERWGLLRLDSDTAAQHFTGKPQNIGVILGEASGGLVDIDLDCPEARSMAPSFLPDTDAVFGRDGNPASHWLYYAHDVRTEQVKFPGTRKTLLELRSNSQTDQPCQTVFPGSVHVGGEPIRWERDGKPATIDAAELVSRFRRLAAATIIARAFPTEGGGRHDATLSLIGLLTRAGEGEANVVEFVRCVRASIGADAKKPLRKMARDASRRFAADRSLFGLPTSVEAFGEKAVSRFCELIEYVPHSTHDTDANEFDDLPGNDAVSDGVDPVTARLNLTHAVVVVKGRTLISTEQKDGRIDFGQPRDLHAFFENDRVPAGHGKTEPASRRWMRCPNRNSYPEGVTFAPGGCSAGTLNLWRGWAVEPDADASCGLFLDHVRAVVCAGDAEHTSYVLGWLAHMVQHPDQKPGVGLVLKGGKGAGKDTVADYVARMIGRRHAPTVAETDHIVGKFNARLESALLLHVQEGSWAGDRKAESVLKYLVTSDRVEIERKGIDSINLPSVLRLFISANAEWVVPASPDERRWAVFEVSSARKGDDAYFKALRAEMNGRGPAALLHYLRSYDLSNFNVRAAPESEGLRNQKIESLRNIELWWFELINRGELDAGWIDEGAWNAARTIGRDTLRGQYVEWMKCRRFDGAVIEERSFGRKLRDMLPGLDDRRPRPKGGGPRSRQYVLPSLVDCRQAFDAWIGSPVDWDAEG